MLSKDGWAGLVVAATSLVFFALTLGLKHNPLVPIGPGFYPRIVLGLTAALGLALALADALRARRRAAAAAPEPRAPNYLAVGIQFALFGAYAGLLPLLGFRLATFAYVAAANALMDPPRGARGLARAALVGFATAAAAWLVFERYLLVLLPRGSWTGF
ncbi:MAG: tripartite tricarboxylate transporter TctB family protein [Burkholderiales bacterium]|nr:tripartite tricarboxylate transporter TctB family protein [Burkholderiales bacterium]